MKANEILREQIFQIISNQLRANNPPETKQTYERLKKLGYGDYEVRQLIGQCLAVELYRVMKYKQPYNNERYVSNLKNLPEEPMDKQTES